MNKLSILAVAMFSLSTLVGCTEEIMVSEKFSIPDPTVIIVHDTAEQVPPTVIVQVTPPSNPPAPATPSNDAGAPKPPATDAGHGRLEVELAATTPPSYIVIGGKDAMVPFTTYRVVNTGNVPMPIHAIGVTQPFNSNGYPKDFAAIGWSINDCAGEIPGMPDAYRVDVNVTHCHIVIDSGSFVTISFSAKVPVITMSAPPYYNAAYSGHTPSLELDSILSNNGEIVFGAQPAPKMVLRKSQPFVTLMPTLITTLANVDMDLIRFSIKADAAGPVAWKQIMFHVYHSAGIELSSFRFRRGSIDLNSGTYSITSVYGGTNLYDHQNLLSDDYVVVSFKESMEEVVSSGSGTVYTLHATVSGAASGSSVYTNIGSQDLYASTGSLEWLNQSHPSSYSFWYHSGDDNAIYFPPAFIWSDVSALPHSAALRESGGSSDWTNGALVQGLSSLSQTLTL